MSYNCLKIEGKSCLVESYENRIDPEEQILFCYILDVEISTYSISLLIINIFRKKSFIKLNHHNIRESCLRVSFFLDQLYQSIFNLGADPLK